MGYGIRVVLVMNRKGGLGKSTLCRALVRFVTLINPGDTGADAYARLQRFMAEALKLLPRFVSE